MSRCIGLVDIQNLVGLKTTASGLSYELDVNGKNKKVNGNWNKILGQGRFLQVRAQISGGSESQS